MTAIKSILFFICAAGLGAGYLPLGLFRTGSRLDAGFLSYLAFPLWTVGIFVILRSFWEFTFKGRGTPAPIDPPRELVITGFYRYVRNPIYVGALSIFLAHFLWFGYLALLIYLVSAFIVVHSFILFYEEPTLRKKFGAPYESYCQSVPRWIPKFK